MLARLKAHLAECGPAPVAVLARRFAVAPQAMEAMLGQLARRGLLRRRAAGGACGGCTKCGPRLQELFEWAGPPRPAAGCGRQPPPRKSSVQRR